MCARGSDRALDSGPSTSPLEARLIGALSQLRVVAISYALLGVLLVACATMLVWFTWPAWAGPFLWHDLGGPTARAIAAYISLGVGFWVLAWMTLLYLALSAAWRGVTLGASALVALWCIVSAVEATLAGNDALGWIATAWGLALAYSLCSYSLWKHRRASNNRWRGP